MKKVAAEQRAEGEMKQVPTTSGLPGARPCPGLVETELLDLVAI